MYKRQAELHAVPVKGDGSYLFGALAFCVYGIGEQHIEVRRQIVCHVVDRCQEYGMHTLTADDISYTNANTYAAAMNKHGTFGYACEVQAAAACVLQLQVRGVC